VAIHENEDGSKYIMRSSLAMPEPDIDMVFTLDQPAMLVGAVVPAEDFAGYPLIHELCTIINPPAEDSIDYQSQCSSPPVFPPPSLLGNSIEGQVTIDKIELVYLALDYPGLVISPDAPERYVQPMWAFSGSTENGAQLQFMVQAVKDEYIE